MRGTAPAILVTGFGPFPGAPVNPTEALVAGLVAAPPEVAGGAFHAAVLDVDYATIAPQLAALGRATRPDIAIHFGLARQCRGFRLERVARNSHARARADVSGGLPEAARVCAGPERLAATLPLERIAQDLEAAGLPVEWSSDAGGYLCNTAMTLSLAHACEGLAPAMSGFVHVPMHAEASPAANALPIDVLLAGARVIVAACLAEWRERAGG